jgi:uncharacterized protein (DUF2236 family)
VQGDPGFFGPDSVTWQVNREFTVLFGGARALLMHAAHPLVSAGARQTAMYQRDPWARLMRTLSLQNAVTFGTRAEAQDAADGINRLHRIIKGADEVTGDYYDALAPDLLLWVHACLEVSSVWFFNRTVRPLQPDEVERYHQESLLAAELVLLERSQVPPTYGDLEDYVEGVLNGGALVRTDVSDNVADLIRTGPVPTPLKPLWKFISFAAFGTLPPQLHEMYQVEWSPARQRLLDLNLQLLNEVRPWLPQRLRWIGPARWSAARLREPSS